MTNQVGFGGQVMNYSRQAVGATVRFLGRSIYSALQIIRNYSEASQAFQDIKEKSVVKVSPEELKNQRQVSGVSLVSLKNGIKAEEEVLEIYTAALKVLTEAKCKLMEKLGKGECDASKIEENLNILNDQEVKIDEQQEKKLEMLRAKIRSARKATFKSVDKANEMIQEISARAFENAVTVYNSAVKLAEKIQKGQQKADKQYHKQVMDLLEEGRKREGVRQKSKVDDDNYNLKNKKLDNNYKLKDKELNNNYNLNISKIETFFNCLIAKLVASLKNNEIERTHAFKKIKLLEKQKQKALDEAFRRRKERGLWMCVEDAFGGAANFTTTTIGQITPVANRALDKVDLARVITSFKGSPSSDKKTLTSGEEKEKLEEDTSSVEEDEPEIEEVE